MHNLNQAKGYIHAILSSATFGLIPLLALPVMATGIGNPTILFYRFLFSAIAMGAIAMFKRSGFKIKPRQLALSFGLGFLYAATALLLLQAYSMIPSGIATTVHFLYPIMVAILMIILFREKASLGLGAAMLLSLIGVGVLSWDSSGQINSAGLLIAFSSVFTYALYIVGVQKTSVSTLNEYTLTFYILLASAILFFINAVATGGIEPVSGTDNWINLILLALLPTVISDLSLILAIKYIGSTTTAILGCMEPLTSVTIGIIVFAEPFGPRIFFGIALVLCAVIIVILSGARQSKSTSLE